MSKRKSRVRGSRVDIKCEPKLWRYASLHDALAANVEVIADLILRGEEAAVRDSVRATPETAPYSKGA